MIIQGITQVKPNYRFESILDETTAINKALDMAPDGSLVVVLPESVNRAIKLIKMRGVQEETQPQQSTHNDSQNGVASSSAINTLI